MQMRWALRKESESRTRIWSVRLRRHSNQRSVEKMMKRTAILALIAASVAGLAIVGVLVHRDRQARRAEELKTLAEAIKHYSSGDGWQFPPSIETIGQSNIVIDGGTTVIRSRVIVHEPTPLDLLEEEQRQIRSMSLIDDRPKDETTEPEN